ncbi:unnamed protein product [Peronospora belbahrii]|uniref:Uncharacterized protein n=1 Tax=Peronospora belbahrii TaxID=622444 RepID=A0ABN8CXI1_9STRA|nr:unnamed protein product [Peronospora belbahrii]
MDLPPLIVSIIVVEKVQSNNQYLRSSIQAAARNAFKTCNCNRSQKMDGKFLSERMQWLDKKLGSNDMNFRSFFKKELSSVIDGFCGYTYVHELVIAGKYWSRMLCDVPTH